LEPGLEHIIKNREKTIRSLLFILGITTRIVIKTLNNKDAEEKKYDKRGNPRALQMSLLARKPTKQWPIKNMFTAASLSDNQVSDDQKIKHCSKTQSRDPLNTL